MRVRTATIVGGTDIVAQSLELQKRPHIIVATPGRLVAHLTGPDPPSFNRLAFLVFDEADRLLHEGACLSGKIFVCVFSLIENCRSCACFNGRSIY